MRPAATAKPAWSLRCAQTFVVEGGDEQFLDQLRHRPAAAAVGEIDPAVLEIEGGAFALDLDAIH